MAFIKVTDRKGEKHMLNTDDISSIKVLPPPKDSEFAGNHKSTLTSIFIIMKNGNLIDLGLFNKDKADETEKKLNEQLGTVEL